MNPDKKILEVDGLTKLYRHVLAVDGLSFSISGGEILGLIGANGAGKTTTIAMLLGLVLPTGGQIRIFGLNPEKHRRKVLERMNFSSPYVSLPHRLTVAENLGIYADLYGVKNKKECLDSVSKELDISSLLKRRYGQLSSGQKTRVAMAKALLNEPDLLLLDEPTASLDPDVAEKVRGCLLSYRNRKGAATIISSHNMQEVERICDRLIILKQGKKIAEGSPKEIISLYGRGDLEEVFIDLVRREENP
jgi:ABC-2 type transport system ATP-binding protein